MTALAALGLIHYLIVDGTSRSVMVLDDQELSARRHFGEVLDAAHSRTELQQFVSSTTRSNGNESLTFASGATLRLGTPSRVANHGRVNANLLVITQDAARALYDWPRPAQIVDVRQQTRGIHEGRWHVHGLVVDPKTVTVTDVVYEYVWYRRPAHRRTP